MYSDQFCKFEHSKVKDQAEYDALPKPWASSGSGSESTGKKWKGKGGGRKGGKKGGKKGDGKGKLNASSTDHTSDSESQVNRHTNAVFDWNFFCKKGFECPGYNDGTCNKCHTDKNYALRKINGCKKVSNVLDTRMAHVINVIPTRVTPCVKSMVVKRFRMA